ncbi:MAG: GW dipeptide domain-containing protein [Gemmatimonadota bacterium]|jgi:hypothetical protein
MLSNRLSAVVLLLTVGVGACANSGDTANAAQQPGQALPTGHPDVASTPSGAATLTGTVLETMDAATYTYVRLKTGDREIWVAGPTTALEVGQDVALASTMDMGKFTSSALNRTFDQIYFTDGFYKPGEVPAPQAGTDPTAGGTIHGGATSSAPAMASGRAEAGQRSGTVKQSIKAAGYTYIEVDADGESVWLAAPEMDLEDGAAISWSGGLIMKDFASKTLNRTFPEILFVDAVQVEG